MKAQGDLILQDIVQVTDHRAKTKPAKRRVFVFEQMIIFSEPFERKKDWTVFIYRHSIKVSTDVVLFVCVLVLFTQVNMMLVVLL